MALRASVTVSHRMLAARPLFYPVRLFTVAGSTWNPLRQEQRHAAGAAAGQKKTGLIWEGYKRNFKGHTPPKRTRLRCKRGTKLCSNPCPICKNGITISYTDQKLLEQFICPHTGQVLETTKTGLCRQQQKRLLEEVEKAWDHGVLPFPIPRELPEDVYKIPPWNKFNIR